MPRRPVVIALIALAAAALLVPIALVHVAGPAAAPVTEPSDEPVAVAEPIRLEEVGWVYAAAPFAGQMETYSLQAGTLGDPAPVLDLQIAFGVDPNNEPSRRPAVGPVVDGSVVYVADDGERSSVRRIGIAPNPPERELAVLNEVVYSIAVTPDGDHAYLALADRADPQRDLGIVRLSLDGRARIERILDPAPAAGREPAIRLAAVAGFSVDITLSADSRHLVRYSCAGAAGCAHHVIDVRTGAVTPVGGHGVLGVAGGIVLAQRCAAECALELIDLASGAVEPFPGQFDATMALIAGEPRVVFVDRFRDGEVLRAVDPREGSAVDIFRAPRGTTLTLSLVSPDVRIALPAGYVLASVSGDDIGAIVDLRSVAIPLEGGQPVELPMAPIRHEFPGAQG